MATIEPIGRSFLRVAAKADAYAAWAHGFRCTRQCGPPEPGAAPLVDSPLGRDVCPILRAEGCEPGLAWLAEEAKAAERRDAAAWMERAEELGIPAVLRPASFASEPRPFLKAAIAYMAEGYPKGRALVLASPSPGVGKSWAAVAALRSVWRAGVRFSYFPGLITRLLTPEERTEALKQACAPGLRVFDDLGREYLRPGGMASSMIDQIIYDREGNRLPTIITTNSTGEQLKAHLSAASYDRLCGWAAIFQGPPNMKSLR